MLKWEKALELISSNNEISDEINEMAKEKFLEEENIDKLSIALVYYLFRSGPIEIMHQKKQLSENDMKTLNKDMANKIAGLLQKMFEDEWLQLYMYYSQGLIKYDKDRKDWDAPTLDTTVIDDFWKTFLNKISNKKGKL